MDVLAPANGEIVEVVDNSQVKKKSPETCNINAFGLFYSRDTLGQAFIIELLNKLIHVEAIILF